MNIVTFTSPIILTGFLVVVVVSIVDALPLASQDVNWISDQDELRSEAPVDDQVVILVNHIQQTRHQAAREDLLDQTRHQAAHEGLIDQTRHQAAHEVLIDQTRHQAAHEVLIDQTRHQAAHVPYSLHSSQIVRHRRRHRRRSDHKSAKQRFTDSDQQSSGRVHRSGGAIGPLSPGWGGGYGK